MEEKVGKKLNCQQACDLYNISRNRFYRLIAAGTLKAYRFRGCKRGLWVYEEDLENCIVELKKSISESF